MSQDYDKAVFVGRFEPFHLEHQKVLKHGLQIANDVIVVIGSAYAAPSVKNPFGFEERVDMIEATLEDHQHGHVHFVALRDYYNQDDQWLAELQEKVSEFLKPGDNVALLGNYKDASSYYIDYLKAMWEFEPLKARPNLDATTIRNKMFDLGAAKLSGEFNPYQAKKGELRPEIDTSFYESLPDGVRDWLKTNYFGTESYYHRLLEFQEIENSKKKYGDGPFVTVDAVVVQSGHVLVVKRRGNYGKGLWALPGGFIKSHEWLEDAMLRELKEETAIEVHKKELRKHIEDVQVFDYPGRSLRGRTITHAYLIDLGGGPLPKVYGGDDAASAHWMPQADVDKAEHKFFEDHVSVIRTLTRGKRRRVR